MLNENFAFEDLRAFAAVARLRSMSKAALALDTTQSTVSKRVQRLEQMLGLQLVDRQTRPIGLTVEGRTFQRLVGGFLESVDAMTQGARDRRQVTVASIPIFISHGLVPAVGAFRAAFPDWQVSIITAGNPSMANLLREGVADLWLTIGGTAGNRLRESSDIAMETFYESDRVLIVPKNHTLATRGITALNAQILREADVLQEDDGAGRVQRRVVVDAVRVQQPRVHVEGIAEAGGAFDQIEPFHAAKDIQISLLAQLPDN